MAPGLLLRDRSTSSYISPSPSNHNLAASSNNLPHGQRKIRKQNVNLLSPSKSNWSLHKSSESTRLPRYIDPVFVVIWVFVASGLPASVWPSPLLTLRSGQRPPSGGRGRETRRCFRTWSSSGPASPASSPESNVCDQNRIWRPAPLSFYLSCCKYNYWNPEAAGEELFSSQFIITISCLTSFWKILDKWGILNHVPHNFVTFSRHRKWDVDMWTFSWWW